MESLRKTARLAGGVYLGVVVTGIFVLMYVPGRLFVEDDAATTVNNILAHQTLFQSYILAGVLSQLLFMTPGVPELDEPGRHARLRARREAAGRVR